MPSHDDEGRGFLRPRRSAIERIVADRDMMVKRAEADAEESRARALRLERELERLRGVLSTQATGESADDPRAQAVQELIGKVLGAAEEAAGRIVEESMAQTEQRLERADDLWEDVRGELERLSGWRERVDPAMREVRARLDEVQRAVSEIPERLREALEPLSHAVSAADGAMAKLAEVGQPPLVVAPGLADDEPASAAEPPAPAVEPAAPAADPEPGRRAEAP